MNGLTADDKIITVQSSPSLSILRLDPAVASVRLSVTASPDAKSLPNDISMEVLPGIYYLEVLTEMTVSAVLSDGYRTLITDPSQIEVTSSNQTVAVVDSATNGVIGRAVGKTMLTVTWRVCGGVLATETIDVEVSFDQHRPEFNPTEGDTTVPEDAPVGYLVYTAVAIDQDSEDIHSDDILYNLLDTQGGKFSIDAQTGQIIVTGSLDRETIANYTLRVQATDQVQRNQLECQNNFATTPIDEGSTLEDITEAPPTNSTGSCPPVSPISVFTVGGAMNNNLLFYRVLSFFFLLLL